MITLSARRLRNIASEAKTEKQFVSLLRYHKIRFYTDEEQDFFRIPCRTGLFLAHRARARFEIHQAAPIPYGANQ